MDEIEVEGVEVAEFEVGEGEARIVEVERIGDDYDLHSGSFTSNHTVYGVFEDKTFYGLAIEALSAVKEDGGVWFAQINCIGGSDAIEIMGDVEMVDKGVDHAGGRG